MIKVYKHYKGYYQSRLDILQMKDDNLLDLLDDLYGRDNLPEDYSHDDLMQEALRQHEIEWRLPEWADTWIMGYCNHENTR